MRRGGKFRAWMTGLVTVVALAGCDSTFLAPRKTSVTPQTRPQGLAAVLRPPPQQQPPSQKSQDLAQYYTRLQADLLVRGLLRTDGGGPDTQFTDTMLARNFERIALAEEYKRGAGLTPSGGGLGAVAKWRDPVRINVEFGSHVPRSQQSIDRRLVANYAAKLARITGHPISVGEQDINFHVLFMSEDDRPALRPRIMELVPDIAGSALDFLDTLPRSIHCLVFAFSKQPNGHEYGQAIAVIRSEHPELLRRSCIHEEIAQGLGLANDDPEARPSIFNDDDEFALLTTHDEMLLKILYDDRLTPGMGVEAARPIIAEKAAVLTGNSS